MYSMVVDESPLIKVQAGKHEVTYSVNGSLMNPLEAFYAALAGCAGVFAKKACKRLGVSPLGIEINCKPFAGSGGPLTLGKYRTEVRFPAGFSADQKTEVLEEISTCAVKEVVKAGASVEFIVAEV